MTSAEIIQRMRDHGHVDADAALKHDAFHSFAVMMEEYNYGGDALETAWHFFSEAYELFRSQLDVLHAGLIISQRIRDDARASSQRYLEEKRQADAQANIFLEDHLKYQEYLNGKPRS